MPVIVQIVVHVLILAVVSPTLICTVENAHYRQRSAPSITARFQDVESGPDWPSRLALEMRFGDSGRSYWWLPMNGGSNGEPFLASTSDVTSPDWQAPSPDDRRDRPLGDVHFIATDASYQILSSAPAKGGPAPAHFLIPDLREARWSRTPPDKREGDARQFFDLTGC